MLNPSRLQAAAVVGLALAAVACVAELNHRLLEKPLRERGKRIAAEYRARIALENL
jgi:peptidoglycan/LPS O-acetylase OafA/YrhL